MKKFTILFLMACVSLSGVAQVLKNMSDFGIKAKYSELFSQKNVMNLPVMAANTEARAKDMAVVNKLKTVAKQAAAQDAGYTEIPSVYKGYLYLEYAGSLAATCMCYGSIVEEESNELYMAYMGGFFKGTRISGPNSLSTRFEELGYTDVVVDSVSFANNQLVLTNEGKNYYVKCTDLSGSSETGWTPVALQGRESFGAYYFPETHELYLPEFVGIYEEGSNTPLKGTVMCDLDFLPAENFENMYKTKVTLTYGAEDVEENNDALAVNPGDGSIYIQGISYLDAEAWLELKLSGSGEIATGANLANGQYLNTYTVEFKDGSKNTLDIYTMALVGPTADGYYNGDSSGFNFILAEDVNGLVLNSDLMNNYGTVGYGVNTTTGEPASTIIELCPQIDIVISNDVISGINGVTEKSKTVVSTEYFDISGRKVDASAEGLIVKKMRYADGTVLSKKVVK